MKIIIDKSSWEAIKKEAKKNFPNECAGFFIGFSILSEAMIDDVRMGVADVFPCKNISEEKTTMSIVSKKEMKKVTKECQKRNRQFKYWIVGQYHSHPTTGLTIQSELDKMAGKKWKEYRYQLIVGLKSKKATVIRRKFYYYDPKSKKWQEAKVTIK